MMRLAFRSDSLFVAVTVDVDLTLLLLLLLLGDDVIVDADTDAKAAKVMLEDEGERDAAAAVVVAAGEPPKSNISGDAVAFPVPIVVVVEWRIVALDIDWTAATDFALDCDSASS